MTSGPIFLPASEAAIEAIENYLEEVRKRGDQVMIIMMEISPDGSLKSLRPAEDFGLAFGHGTILRLANTSCAFCVIGDVSLLSDHELHFVRKSDEEPGYKLRLTAQAVIEQMERELLKRLVVSGAVQ
jgi:hypothetical protein